MTENTFDEQKFNEKLLDLQKQAIKNNKRIIIIGKGYSKPRSIDSSLGKPHKGHQQKRVSGEGVFYQEPKKRVSYTLTPTARYKIQQLSEHLQISESETIERFGRSWIPGAIVKGEIELENEDSLD